MWLLVWKTPLAWLSLLHHKGRFLVSIAGVALAVIMMFMQVGFRNGMLDSQIQLITKLNGELFIINKIKNLIFVPDRFARSRLQQAAAFEGVQAAYPLYMENLFSIWKNPRDGTTRPIRVMAFNPHDPVFLIPEVQAHADQLRMPNTILFDVRSKDYYGNPRIGEVTELAQRNVEVIGTFRLGTDFLTDGSVIMSDRNFLKFFPPPYTKSPELSQVDIGILKLEPGADVLAVQAALRQGLPDDVLVLTRQEFIELETKFWQENSAIGYVFTLGTAVGFLVGLVICYQILYTNVQNSLPQYATLKAMGYSDRYLVSVVLQQGFFLAIAGFIPALALNHLLYQLVASLTGLIMELTPLRIALVLLLTVGMCMTAGAIAMRKVLTADPAEVFQ